MILDFDSLESKLEQVKKKAEGCPYTMACFISPKANGLKVLVRTDSSLETHSQVYEEVASYYQKITKAKLDMQCKDVGRLCFYSYDPDVYVNENAQTFYSYSGSLNSPELFQQQATVPATSMLLAQQHAETAKATGSTTASNPLLPLEQQEEKRAYPQENPINFNHFEKAVSLTEKKLAYTEGNRNSFVFLLASNCN